MTDAVVSPAIFEEFRSSHDFGRLVQRRVGLVDSLHRLMLRLGECEAEVVGASLDSLGSVFPHVPPGETRGGAGSDQSLELAWLKSLVETVERYATMVFQERDFVIGSRDELGASALDLTCIPRCSSAEYDEPRCPIRPASNSDPIRWVPGWSLTQREERLVPAVMTHLHMRPWDGENFWMQTSTGVAAHSTLEGALASAICEVIERDALALMWLGRIPLQPISMQPDGDDLAAILRRADRSLVEFHTYEATTDLGVPTVLSVHLRGGHPTCAVTLSCATSLDAAQAFRKTFLEATSVRIALDAPVEVPPSVDDFVDLDHGARYFGTGDRRAELAFLLDQDRSCVPLDPSAEVFTPSAALDHLVATLQRSGLDAVAVDLTTDELRRVGLWVVRVLVPGLLPVSFVHRARYLGTPRLYEYLSAIGRPLDEADLNPSPLPFA